jgi:HTH-type transcriptional regulator/antitoxin HigA
VTEIKATEAIPESDEGLQPAADMLVSPGEILKEELDARGWTQKDLAAVMARPTQAISEIINGSKQITPQTALELAGALGTTAEIWTNLEADYRLGLARGQGSDDTIGRRGRLYGLAPITELLKRGWIPGTGDLEAEVCAFLGIASIFDEPAMLARLRHSAHRGPETSAIVAWLKRVEWLASQQVVADYGPAQLEASLDNLAALSVDPAQVATIPGRLAALGVHFVIVPHLSKTFLDGASMWGLDDRPVVAVTLRYDRVDSFWFTLLHELAHVLLGHTDVVLDRLDDAEVNSNPIEIEASTFAEARLLDPERFATVADALQFSPPMSRIEAAARVMGRHPGILVGRLQHDGVLGFGQGRTNLVKVSPHLTDFIDRPIAA